MRRKIALLVTMMMIFSAIQLPQSANYTYAASGQAEQVINALGIMNTDKGSNVNGTGIVTRDRFAQMLVNISSQKDKVPSKINVSLFKDVSKKYWAAKYIQVAVSQGWMSGYLNGTFKPTKGIKLQEAVNGILKILGYSSSDFNGNITGSQMSLYESKDLNTDINKKASSYLTVNDCINLFYNTLNATIKDGKVYALALGYTLNSENQIDYLSFVKTETKGPVIVQGEWKTKIPFSLDSATYYRNGVKCKYADISDYDVLYYSKNVKTIWAYDNKITGTVQTISPNTISPTSVKVAGTTYTLDGSEVSIAFSTMGSIEEGDVVTLLLGKDGTAVGVVNIDEYNSVITGVALSTGTHLIKDTDGNYISSDYVTFVDAAGNQYDQDYDTGAVTFEQGELVQVIYTNGTAQVSKITKGSSNLANTFNSTGSKLGTYALASNAKILDLHDTNYITVNPARLANVTLSDALIYYYDLNTKGEITKLILYNVTGDADKYGVLTKVSNASSTYSYNYYIKNSKASANVASLLDYNCNIGPKGFVFNGTTLSSSYALNEITVYSIGKTTVQDKNTLYPLADEYSVYYLNDDEYTPTTLDTISNLKKYTVKAYYDKLPSVGGRIRVIVAESIN